MEDEQQGHAEADGTEVCLDAAGLGRGSDCGAMLETIAGGVETAVDAALVGGAGQFAEAFDDELAETHQRHEDHALKHVDTAGDEGERTDDNFLMEGVETHGIFKEGPESTEFAGERIDE